MLLLFLYQINKMKDIKEIEIEGDRINLKKSFDGWRVCYPYKNSDGTFNYFNLLTGGTWWNVLKVLIVVGLILGLSFGYYNDVKVCRDCMANPCDYCYGSILNPNPIYVQNLNITWRGSIDEEEREEGL